MSVLLALEAGNSVAKSAGIGYVAGDVTVPAVRRSVMCVRLGSALRSFLEAEYILADLELGDFKHSPLGRIRPWS